MAMGTSLRLIVWRWNFDCGIFRLRLAALKAYLGLSFSLTFGATTTTGGAI